MAREKIEIKKGYCYMEIQFPNVRQCTLVFTSEFCASVLWAQPRAAENNMSLICDKSVRTQNLAFLSYWYGKKRLEMHF
jgi:hypothetical protein